MSPILPKPPADRAYLLRVIARTVTESMPAPETIEITPSAGTVSLRFDDDQVPAVEAWAAMLGVAVVRERLGEWWFWASTDHAGTPWHGWLLHVWCKVNGPPPDPENAGQVAQTRSMRPVPVTNPALREDEVAFS